MFRRLRAQIIGLRPALVIIDSLTTHKPSRVDLNSHGDVAPMLVALRKLAATHGCAIVVIHHTNKMQTGDPLAKISGSIGITATARHVILVAEHPEDENSRVAAIAKTNLVRPDAPGYRFCLSPFAWQGETELRASDLLQVPLSPQLAARRLRKPRRFFGMRSKMAPGRFRRARKAGTHRLRNQNSNSPAGGFPAWHSAGL